MKKLKLAIILALTLLPVVRAQDVRFFRVNGPVVTTITSFTADGYLTWTNVPTNAVFTVQTASSPAVASNWVNFVQVPASNGVTTSRVADMNPPMGQVLIPAGSFTMGNTFPEGDSVEEPAHSVYVSEFYMDRYEVTKALWDEVCNWATNHGYRFEYGALGKTNTHPAHSMTWYDCVKWCNARSEMENRTPAYYTGAEQTNVYRSGVVDIQNGWVNWGGGYRLPTEAEWEKAARGGISGWRFPWGDTITHSNANYYAYPLSADPVNGLPYDLNPTEGYHPTFLTGPSPFTSPVGYFAPNGYGLYDMAGNVWEWCWDWYGAYSADAQTDPRGPASGSGRMYRGGGWVYDAFRCRVSSRYDYYPTDRISFIGFRCARGS